MTRTEILRLRLDELDKERTNIQVRTKRLYIRKVKELRNVLEDWFVPLNIEDKDVTFKFTDFLRVEVIAKKINKDQAAFWFEIKEEWDGKTTYTGFNFNQFHRGSTVNEDLVKIFFLSAQWSQFVLDYQDDIIAELNMVQERYDNYIQILGDKEKELRKAINQQESDIDELEKENNLTKLTTEGIELDTNKRESKDSFLPSLTVKYDWTLYSVKALKVLRMTASKKSADVEVTTRDWQGSLHKTVVEKVRMDNILHFVNYNRDIIV